MAASLLFITTTIASTDVRAAGACGADNDFVQGDGSAATPNTQKCYDPANGNRELDSPTPAGAPITNPPPGTDAGGTAGDGAPEEDISCAIEKVGWILCPIIETVGKMGDQAFQFLSKNFLEVEAELVSSVGSVDGNKSGTYYAWELARNMANIMFIAAFLIIILSQVTGRGIDNYGIKKTLPRLIIAAIAVNASFYICQAMVDLSNILGYEIQNFLVDVSREVSDVAAMPVQAGIDNQTSNGTLGTIALWVLGATAVVWLLLPILLLGVTTVLVTCIVIIVILLLRKAFIVLLVVASPVAFVMYLLPNTEKYFKQWLGMFWKLLMVFPVVGLLFGGGQLASSIVLIAGTSGNTDSSVYKTNTDQEKCIQLPSSTPQTVTAPGQNPVPVPNTGGASVGDCGTRSVPMMLGIVAAGIAVAPLLAVWAVLKAALQGMGSLGGKISGAVDTYTNKGGKKFSEGAGARMSKRAGILANNNGLANAATLGRYRRKARRKAVDAGLDKELNRAEVDYTSGLAARSASFQGQLAGGRGLADTDARQRAAATAVSQQHALDEENKKAAHATVDEMDVYTELMTGDGKSGKLLDRLNSGDLHSAETAAMLERTWSAGNATMKKAIVDALREAQTKAGLAGQSTLASRTLSSTIAGDNPGYISAGQLDSIRLGTNNSYENMIAETITKNKYTADKMTGSDKSDVELAKSVVSSMLANGHSQQDAADAAANLKNAAAMAVTSEQTRGRIKDARETLHGIGGVPYP